ASFTTKELREMMTLQGVALLPIDQSILIPPPDVTLTRQQSRILQLLQKGSANAPGTTPRTWSLEFYRSPTGLTPPTSPDSSPTLTLAHTTLDPSTRRAILTNTTSTLPTSLMVTSLGFHGEPSNEFYDAKLGHLRTVANRVVSSSGMTLKNVYASGWSATG